MQLRDESGNHYEAVRRSHDATTKLRRLAAQVEGAHGLVVIVAPARVPVKMGPVSWSVRGWEIIVADSLPPTGSAGMGRARRLREGLAFIRGVGLGAGVRVRQRGDR